MSSPFDTDTEHQIHAVAVSMVDCERVRQIEEKDYRCSLDDHYLEQELATAAAYYLMPAWLGQVVSYVNTDAQLATIDLIDLVAESTFPVSRSDEAADIETAEGLDQRIDMVTRGCALGVAELERLLRRREASGVKEA